MNLRHRVSDALPYLLLSLGVLLYLSPLAPLTLDKTEDFLVVTAPHYVVAGVLTLLAAHGRGERSLHMAVAPVAALVASAGMLLPGMLLIPEPPPGVGNPPYSPEVLEIAAYSSVSVLFSLGIAIRTREMKYVAVLALVYVAIATTIAVSLLDADGVVSLGEAAVLFVATVVPLVFGIPLGIVGYICYGEGDTRKESGREVGTP